MFAWDLQTETTTVTEPPILVGGSPDYNAYLGETTNYTYTMGRGDYEDDTFLKYNAQTHRVYDEHIPVDEWLASSLVDVQPICRVVRDDDPFVGEINYLHGQFHQYSELISFPTSDTTNPHVNFRRLRWRPRSNGFRGMWGGGIFPTWANHHFSPLIDASAKEFLHTSHPWLYGIPDTDRDWALIKTWFSPSNRVPIAIGGNFPPAHPGEVLPYIGNYNPVTGRTLRRVINPGGAFAPPAALAEQGILADDFAMYALHTADFGFPPWWGLPPDVEMWCWARGSSDLQLELELILDQVIWPSKAFVSTVIATETLPKIGTGGWDCYGGQYTYSGAARGVMHPLCLGFRYRIVTRIVTGFRAIQGSALNHRYPPGTVTNAAATFGHPAYACGGDPGMLAGYELSTVDFALRVHPAP